SEQIVRKPHPPGAPAPRRGQGKRGIRADDAGLLDQSRVEASQSPVVPLFREGALVRIVTPPTGHPRPAPALEARRVRRSGTAPSSSGGRRPPQQRAASNAADAGSTVTS